MPYVIASRSDSTLRGYFPLETDVWPHELERLGTAVDGVVICPAYIEPGRVTVDSMHWMRTNDGMIPVAQSEFARGRQFRLPELRSSDWVEEKTGGRISRLDVATITLTDIREGGPDRVQEILGGLHDGSAGRRRRGGRRRPPGGGARLVRAEAAGKSFVYRTGPSFVRSRSGQEATPAVDASPTRWDRGSVDIPGPTDAGRPSVQHGLIAVGSHVGLTTRQLDQLRTAGHILELELNVPDTPGAEHPRSARHRRSLPRRRACCRTTLPIVTS